jgi:superfamily I DNA/RNA helicase
MSGTWWVEEDDLRDEQLEVLGCDQKENLLILGPPGSGKTNLLLLRANHLHLINQPEFYIVAYTSLLSKFIRTGATLYDFPVNKIITQDRLFEMVLGDHGIVVPRMPDENFEARKSALKAAMARLVNSGRGKGTFPALFVDEAQDCSPDELSYYFYLAETVCLSADARQGIYDNGADALAWLDNRRFKQIRLTMHYRVGRNIIELADRLMNGKMGHIPMLPTAQYNEAELPSTVEVEGPISLDEQVAKATRRLMLQLRAYPNQKLGVLVPRKAELAPVLRMLAAVPGLVGKITDATSRDFDPEYPVWVSTVHSAKGLEFRAVHLLTSNFIENFKAYSRRLAFTAVTRAKTALVIYFDAELPPFFAAALAAERKTKVPLSALFGKAK